VVDIAERHARHSPAGSVAPSVMQAPPMRQPVETVPPPHAPAVHVVPLVHESASSHVVASSTFEYAVVDVAGRHAWQSFVGLSASVAMHVLLMRQPVDTTLSHRSIVSLHMSIVHVRASLQSRGEPTQVPSA
jgi:hypothetical protein